ncbi:hypothetical protein EP7_002541 [Isosphaeraceae bacterium EP7]
MNRIGPRRLFHRIAVTLLILGVARFPQPAAPDQPAEVSHGQCPAQTDPQSGPWDWIACGLDHHEGERDAEAESPTEEVVDDSANEATLAQRLGFERSIARALPEEIERLITRPARVRLQAAVPPCLAEYAYIRHLSGADGPDEAHQPRRV